MRHTLYTRVFWVCLSLPGCGDRISNENAQQDDAARPGPASQNEAVQIHQSDAQREANSQSGLVKAALEKPGAHAGFFAFAFSPDGQTIAGGTGFSSAPAGSDDGWAVGGEVLLWDANSGELKATLGKHGESVTFLQFSDDGEVLLSLSSKNQLVKVWQLPQGTARQTFNIHGEYYAMTKPVLSPAGQWLANVRREQLQVGDQEITVQGQLTVWDVQSGEAKWSLPQSSVHALASSPDGKFLAGYVRKVNWEAPASGGASGRVEKSAVVLWDANTGAVVWELLLEEFSPRILAFQPNGHSLVGLDDDSMVRWDAETGAEIDRINVQGSHWPAHFAFSRDGQTFAIARNMGEQVELWDLANKRLKAQLDVESPNNVWHPAFSPDLHRMACVQNFKLVIIDLTQLPVTVSGR